CEARLLHQAGAHLAQHSRRMVGDGAHGRPELPDRASPVPQHGPASSGPCPTDRARLLRQPGGAVRGDIARALLPDRGAIPEPRGPRGAGSVRLPGGGELRPLRKRAVRFRTMEHMSTNLAANLSREETAARSAAISLHSIRVELDITDAVNAEQTGFRTSTTLRFDAV